MRTAIFGHGAPLGVMAALGIAAEDISLAAADPCAEADQFLEEFIDPFVRSVLRRLVAGQLDIYDQIIFFRDSPGAVHAFHYACEYERRGLLSCDAPTLFLSNLLSAGGQPELAFNQSECDRLAHWIGRAPPLAGPGQILGRINSWQNQGRINGKTAWHIRRALLENPARWQGLFPEPQADTGTSRQAGKRLALLGEPLGNDSLHELLDQHGCLVFDQQAENISYAAGGDDLNQALSAYASNPYAPRLTEPIQTGQLADDLARCQADFIVWQTDARDDLWGWLAPQIRHISDNRGIGFIDLGFMPRWPAQEDLDRAASLLANHLAQGRKR